MFFQEKEQVNKEVNLGVRKANNMYITKIESKFADDNLRNAWKGISSLSPINNRVESKGYTNSFVWM